MAKLLRQSTASQEIPIGRCVDSTDGDTEKTALSPANTDIKIWKSGATTLASKNSGGATHIANGIYYAVLDATDTDTLGPLKLYMHMSGMLAWEDSYLVVPGLVYDAMCGTDQSLFGITDAGTSQAVGATTLTAQTGAPTAVTTNSSCVGKTIKLLNGANAGATAKITSNVGSTKVLTFSGGWSNGATPSGTPIYVIYDTPPDAAIASGLATIAKLEAAFASSGVFSEASMANVGPAIGLVSSDADTQLANILAKAANIQTRLPASLDGNLMRSTSGLYDAITEIYAATGIVPSVAQAVLAMYQMMRNASVDANGLMTVADVTGSGVAFTLQLNAAYPASLPTGIAPA